MKKIRTAETTSLGDCIRRERKKMGLSQTDLGQKIGLTASRISKIEKGSPITIDTASFILEKMGSDVKLNVTSSITNSHSASFLMSCVYRYAKSKNIPLSQSYKYLKTFKGLDYLKHYQEIEQTLPFEEISENLSKICAHNGGRI